MSAVELLRRVVEGLEASNIPYALTGSVASMAYGEPRATLDIDVVVALAPADIPRLRKLFPDPEFYMDEETASGVVAEGGQFNVIHPASGLKIDFFVVADEITQAQIARRQRRLALPDLEATFSPPEELMIKKLQYYRIGGSEKHLRDVAAMWRISSPLFDLERVERLAAEHGVSDLWHEVRNRSHGS